MKAETKSRGYENNGNLCSHIISWICKHAYFRSGVSGKRASVSAGQPQFCTTTHSEYGQIHYLSCNTQVMK